MDHDGHVGVAQEARLRRISPAYAAKVAIAYALYYSGVFRLWQRVALRQRAVVLMYHRVLTPAERRQAGSHPGIIVGDDTFARHIAVLTRDFVLLSIAEFTRHLEQGIPFPDSSCLVTFDDGWKDNLSNALPVMRAHDVPAVIFLPVHFIGRQRSFSREALTHLLARVAAEVARHPDRRSEFEAPLSETGLASVLQPEFDGSHEAVLQAMGNGALDEPRAALVPRLAAALGVSLADIARHDPFLDWAQVSEMSRAGVAFGGHGAEHKLLGRVAAAEALDEIQTSKGWLDEKVNEPVPTFAYPNGDYTDSVVDMVKAAGYRLAFTTVPGFVRCDDDRHRLRRLNIHEHATASTPMFMARVLGLF